MSITEVIDLDSYSISIKSIPSIAFAHEYATDNYDISFPTNPNFIEISYLLEGDSICYRGNQQKTISVGSFMIGYRTEPVRFYSKGRHHHITVGFYADIQPGNDLVLPEHMIFPGSEKLVHELKQIVEEYTLYHTTTVKLIGMLFTLMADLDFEYRRIALHDSVSYSEQRYTEAAKRYIIGRIREKIYVSEVADYVHLSVAYLSNLFKRCTGQTLIEYINITKLNLVKSLMINDSLSVKDAGRAVGFTDENYVSRIYKKYFGRNLTDPSGAGKQNFKPE